MKHVSEWRKAIDNGMEERYEDCDRCGERYHGEDIDRWLRDEKRTPSKHFDETWRVCCEGQRSTEGLIEGRHF